MIKWVIDFFLYWPFSLQSLSYSCMYRQYLSIFLHFKKTTQHYCIYYSDHYPVHQVERGQVSLFSSVFTLSVKYYHNLCYWPKFWLQIIQNYFLQP